MSEISPCLVTICVPVYGAEKYIGRCAESVFGQTYANLECVFVDDGTPDHSMEVVRKVLERYPGRKAKTKLLHHDHNRGISAARNTLVAESDGEFVFHLDADDWIEPETIERLVECQLATGADIVTTGKVVNEDEVVDVFDEPDFASADEMLDHFLSQEWHHELAGRLVRRSLFDHDDVGVLEGCDLCEDWHIMVQLAWYARRVSMLDGRFYHYRMNDDSIVHQSIRAEHKKKRMQEKYANLSSLVGFFASKSPKYVLKVQKLCAPFCLQILVLGLDTGDRTLYHRFRKEFLGFPRSVRRGALDRKHRVLLASPCGYLLLRAARKLAGRKE